MVNTNARFVAFAFLAFFVWRGRNAKFFLKNGENVVFSNENGYVWTGPKFERLKRITHSVQNYSQILGDTL